jgi:hypothetical protein
MITYVYGRGLYGRQFSSWSPPIWFVHDDFGNLVEVRS